MKKLSVTALVLLALGCVEKKQPTAPVATQPAATPAAATNDEFILFGEYGSLTGSEATFGISTKQGIETAVKELNDAGGILGKKIKVIVYDDQGKPEEANTVVTKLITQDKVHVV